jgi:hypothetical protein
MTVNIPESVEVSPVESIWIAVVPVECPVKTALLLSPAGIKSESATPPVLEINDQVAATLAKKLPYWSLVIE